MTALFNCSRLFATQGAHAAAARVYAADRALHAAAYPKGEDDASWYALLGERRLELARQAVGPELVAAAVAEGQAMSLDAAVAHARQQLGVSAG
jgi:hypothetical protein